MSLVNDVGRPEGDPAGIPATLADYKSWRRLAVEVRASVIATTPEGAKDFLMSWASSGASVLERGKAMVRANPKFDALVFPPVPMNAGVILAMGGAKIFTGKLDALVSYVRRGDAMVPEGEGTRGLKQARTRAAGPDGGTDYGKLAVGVGASVVAGLVVYGVTQIIDKVRGPK